MLHTAAAALACAGVAATLWRGLDQPGNALAFGALIAIGETIRWGVIPGEREPAPLGAAGALAYALLGACGGVATTHSVLQVVAVVAVATLAGAVPRLVRGRGFPSDRVVRRVLTAGFAAVCFQPLSNSGEPDHWARGAAYALLILVLLMLTALGDAVLTAALRRARTGFPYAPLLRDELRSLRGIGSAVCSAGAVIALAVATAGLWALPVFCVPLLLTHVSLRRYAAVKATYRQTIASLARSTEIAGYTRPGHAQRVAGLSRAVGRELGLSGPDLTVLEYAALMHDIGQLSLVDPVPDGATALLPQAEQRRIALLGGAVVRRAGVPAAVAVVVERQADAYREQPLAARIVRTVNAYDDLTGGTGAHVGNALEALEQLRLSTGQDHQPEVVESLARVLAGA
ncbi:HD-GYP domain-containing protein [Streptomyces sp. NPDC004838]